MQGTCNPCNLKIPVPINPCRIPVNPCKNQQCRHVCFDFIWKVNAKTSYAILYEIWFTILYFLLTQPDSWSPLSTPCLPAIALTFGLFFCKHGTIVCGSLSTFLGLALVLLLQMTALFQKASQLYSTYRIELRWCFSANGTVNGLLQNSDYNKRNSLTIF